MNLLQETINDLSNNGKTPDDVVWVGSREIKTDWENFRQVADVEYDDGFGATEVATDLLIVGEDWWMERHEYDGAEWWEFKRMPNEPSEKVTLTRVVGGVFDDLKELNNL